MRLSFALSVSSLCFLTRCTCASVPVFDDVVPARWQQRHHQSFERRRRAENQSGSVAYENDENGRASTVVADSTLYQDERMKELADYLMRRVEQCAAKAPDHHGLLVHITDRSRSIPLSRLLASLVQDGKIATTDQHSETPATDERKKDEADNQGFVVAAKQKRLLKSMGRTWKSMPTNQRLQAVATLSGALSVPMYLANAAQVFDELSIKKVKLDAAQAKLVKSGGAKAPAKSTRSTNLIPPPPVVVVARGIDQEAMVEGVYEDDVMDAVAVDDWLRQEKQLLTDSSSIDDRLLHRASTGSAFSALGKVHLPSGWSKGAKVELKAVLNDAKATSHYKPSRLATPSAHSYNGVGAGAKFHAPAHYSPAHYAPAQHSSGSATSKVAPKQPNEAAGRVLNWVGVSTSILYLPIAYTAYAKTRRIVTQDDLKKYRRQLFSDLSTRQSTDMPVVTCVPIEHVKGTLDEFIIPNGGLSMPQTDEYDDDDELDMPWKRRDFLKRNAAAEQAGKSAMKAMGSNAKLVGIGVIGTTLGYVLHRLGQRRSVDAEPDEANVLLRRSGTDSGDVPLQKRFWGKGTVLFAGILAGSGLSRAGVGLPNLHPALVEGEQAPAKKPKRALPEDEEDGIHLVRRNKILKAMNDKVAITVGSIVAGFVGVKSGLFGKIGNAVKHPNMKPPPASPGAAAPVRRSLVLGDADTTTQEVRMERRIERVLSAFLGVVGGAFIAARTGKMGQKREDKQYLKQLGIEQPKAHKRAVDYGEQAQCIGRNDSANQNHSNDKRAHTLSPASGVDIEQLTWDKRSMHYVPGTFAAVVVAGMLAKKVLDKKTSALPNRLGERRADDQELVMLVRRSPVPAGSKEIARSLSRGAEAIKDVTLSLTAKLGRAVKSEGHYVSPHGGAGRGRDLVRGARRAASPSPTAGRLMRQESVGSTAPSSHSRSHSPAVVEHVRTVHVGGGSRGGSGGRKPKVEVHEYHHYHHEAPAPSADHMHTGESHNGGSHSGGDPHGQGSKRGKGKAIAIGLGGAAAGVAGHAMYTQGKQNIANQQAAMAAAEGGGGGGAGGGEGSGGGEATAKRSIVYLQDVSPDSKLQKRATHKVIHEHHFHHVVPAETHLSHQHHAGPAESHLSHHAPHIKPSTSAAVESQLAHSASNIKPKAGGGGMAKAIGAMVVGAAIGVVGHALWHNAANRNNNPAPPAEPAGDPSAEPAAQKRSFDDVDKSVVRELTLSRRGFTFGHALSGALIGTAVTSWAYAMKHDNPGTRQKHTVPKGVLPDPGAPAKRSVSDSDEALHIKRAYSGASSVQSYPTLFKRNGGGGGMMKMIKSFGTSMKRFMSKDTKMMKGTAIATGIGLSTAAALVDPGPKEAKGPSLQRRGDDVHLYRQSLRAPHQSFKPPMVGKNKCHFDDTFADLHKRSLTMRAHENVRVKRAFSTSSITKIFKPITEAYAKLGVKHGRHAQHAVVVSGVAAVAGMANMLKKREGQDALESLDKDKGNSLSKRATFESHAGKMMDYGTIALIGGTFVRHVFNKLRKKAPASGTPPSKRDVVTFSPDRGDIVGETMLLKRSPFIGAVMGAAGMIPTAVSVVKGIVKGIKKKGGKRDLGATEVSKDALVGNGMSLVKRAKFDDRSDSVSRVTSIKPALVQLPKILPKSSADMDVLGRRIKLNSVVKRGFELPEETDLYVVAPILDKTISYERNKDERLRRKRKVTITLWKRGFSFGTTLNALSLGSAAWPTVKKAVHGAVNGIRKGFKKILKRDDGQSTAQGDLVVISRKRSMNKEEDEVQLAKRGAGDALGGAASHALEAGKRAGPYKFVNIASFATIGGSILAPIVKQVVKMARGGGGSGAGGGSGSGKGAAKATGRPRIRKRATYDDYIEKVKTEAEKVRNTAKLPSPVIKGKRQVVIESDAEVNFSFTPQTSSSSTLDVGSTLTKRRHLDHLVTANANGISFTSQTDATTETEDETSKPKVVQTYCVEVGKDLECYPVPQPLKPKQPKVAFDSIVTVTGNGASFVSHSSTLQPTTSNARSSTREVAKQKRATTSQPIKVKVGAPAPVSLPISLTCSGKEPSKAQKTVDLEAQRSAPHIDTTVKATANGVTFTSHSSTMMREGP